MSKIVLLYQKHTFPFIFEAASKMGVDLYLVLHPDEQKTGISEEIKDTFTAVVDVSFIDVFTCESIAISKLKRLVRDYKIEGVLCFRDEVIPFVSKAAPLIGLKYFNSPEVAVLARDKGRMREAFQDFSCNVPSFLTLTQGDDLIKKCEGLTINFPVVVKPVSGFGSLGVIKAKSMEELIRATNKVDELNRAKLANLSQFNGDSYLGIIVEEFIDGPEYVAETYSVNGEHYILSLGDKGDPLGPYFEEGIYIAPAKITIDIRESILQEVRKSLDAINLLNGPAHVELRVDRNSLKPFVVEIGARIGGSGVSQFIVESLWGISMFELCVRDILGDNEGVKSILNSVDFNSSTPNVAMNYIIPIGKGGKIAEIRNIDLVKQHHNEARVVRFMNDGVDLKPYPDFSGYPGFILSKHPSEISAKNFLKFLEENVVVAYLSEDGVLKRKTRNVD